jgi:uncharacterized SAM-binding protein YcdF (DUF218 family)
MDTMRPRHRTIAAPRRGARRRWLLGVLALVVVTAGAVVAGRNLGRWLIVADPLERVAVAAVMAGDTPFRAVEAAALLREGWIEQIWLTRPAVPAAEAALARFGIEYVTADDYSRAVLARLDVPAAAIHTVPDRVDSTPGELDAIAREVRRRGLDRVMIVTSPAHTRRVRTTWLALVGASPRALIRPVREDPHDLVHWWRRKRDAKAVVGEWFGILNAWTGFPLRGDLD